MQRNDESGFMLVGTILAIVFLAVVGLSLTTLAVYSLNTSSNERNNQSAYYIAEAGLTYLANDFEQNIQEIYADESVKTKDDFYNKIDELEYIIGEKTYDQFEKVNDIQPFAQLKIEPLSTAKRYQLVSTGYLENEKRTVTQVVQIDWKEKYEESGGAYELPPFVIFSNGDFTMGSGYIKGDIGTLSEAPGSIYFLNAGGRHEGTIYVLESEENIVTIENSNINSEIDWLDQSYGIPSLPPFPEFPTYACPEDEVIKLSEWNTHKIIDDCNLRVDSWIVKDSEYVFQMNENIYFKEMTFASNYTLKIDVQDEDREIVVDHLNISNGHIELLGTGRLTIYVTDEITFGSGSTVNNNGDVSRLDIYLKGTGNPHSRKIFKVAGEQKIYGSFYAEDADIELTGGGGFVGNIFTGGKNFKISGGFENIAQLFFAPNAFVDMTTGGNENRPFRGKIIADRIAISGGWHVYIEDIFLSDGPISPAALALDHGEGGSGGDSGVGPGSVETGNKLEFTKSSVREIKQ